MTTAPFAFPSLFRADLPDPAKRWMGFPKFNFVGGHNDADSVPVEDFIAAAEAVLRREGATLATYGLQSGPQGYKPLRAFVAEKMKKYAGISCSADDILITSGSLQGLDLVNQILVTPGDTVLVEEETYGGALSRLRKHGAKIVGMPLDSEGIRMDRLAEILEGLKRDGIQAKYIYTIPTVQNPTGSILSAARRTELLRLSAEYGVPILEDECYADLLWDGERPSAIYAIGSPANVIHVGSFSKSLAPALRVGYVIAGWDVLSRMLSRKSDAGSGAMEQMILAEYCTKHFDDHVTKLNVTLRGKLDALIAALEEQFGTAAEFEVPKGGIFLWVTLPAEVDTSKLAVVAAQSGVAINPGAEWSTNAETGKRRLRICFANPTIETIQAGVAALADICHRETGIPIRSSNVER